jgi:two-component system, OmpR family, phosphate regulon sensor histidine kinase PhoR
MKRSFYNSFFYKILFVTIIMIAELSWWIIFTNRNTNERINDIKKVFQEQKYLAEYMLERGLHDPDLHEKFKDYVIITHENKVFINQEMLNYRLNRESSKRTMFVSETSLFFILIFVSLLYVYKSYRTELHINSLQHNFMLSISHELKTPLASIKLYLQTLLGKNLEQKQKERFANIAINEVDRLTALIENILLSVKLDEKYDFKDEEKQLVSKSILQTLEKFKLTSSYIFKANIDDNISSRIKPDIFTIIVNNLVSNAIKYGNDEGEITINLFKNDDKMILEVSDNGPGISDDERKNIFDRFYRIGSENERKQTGTGLGLYIVSQIVKGLEGEIECLANNGKGSIFRITLSMES